MTVPTSAPVLSEFHSGGRALPHNVATSVEVLTTFEQIAAVRDQWERWNWFPETDADFVRIIVETRPEAKAPCVIVLRQDGVIQAMLVGRIEISRLNSLPAWTTPELKVLRVVYAGLLGDWSEENIDTCLRELKQGLSRGDWQAVHFHMLDSRIRKNLNRHRKRLEREFSDLSVKRFDQISDLETILNTSEAIIAKTYQQGFATGWATEEMK